MNKIVIGRTSPYIKTGSYEQFEIKYQPNADCDGTPLKFRGYIKWRGH